MKDVRNVGEKGRNSGNWLLACQPFEEEKQINPYAQVSYMMEELEEILMVNALTRSKLRFGTVSYRIAWISNNILDEHKESLLSSGK
ncbi:hypothetical protein ACTWPF_06300 [Oceanobacillus sp. M65]|uniref:Uncharacterized protein n=1 Tax=Oceanobacillus jordanicus TaxID=2867266 RepID=A0AAW5BB59_9BACI|nr:hypothetical protein [Oceanobacillus jordanicus]MCG3420319.1 hypothetical protein [Oceanobacillus jordanicus]